ncbi:MAG TPA: hypothetical protein VKM55_09670 [Candidatus Lokiarchaeia archaeon]|nr:hypothetical protein [Candidatus Lokiarchaeia archaeon]
MVAISKRDLEKIKKEVEAEFSEDPALQQVHIARKIITREAELNGLSFFEYIQRLEKEKKKTIHVCQSYGQDTRPAVPEGQSDSNTREQNPS